MFARIRQRLGIVSVQQTPTYIIVEGINTNSLFKDMYNVWGSNVIAKNMFSVVRPHELRMRHFFGLDFLYVLQTLYDSAQTRSPRRILGKVIAELKYATWLGDVDRQGESITDVSKIDSYSMLVPKPYQREFVQHYGKMVPAYRLRGYLLDSAPGSGKTLGSLMLAHCLKRVGKKIVVCPANAAVNVWQDTLIHKVVHPTQTWVSDGRQGPPNLDYDTYVVHYEALEKFLDFVKANARAFESAFVDLDESHNFNRGEALRTQFFVELVKLIRNVNVLWMSGTPLLAMGKECIPFLECVDPLFDDESRERFRKIYGRDAKRANDILRNRLGHLKYHVPRETSVKIETVVETIKVKVPHSERYTLEAISAKMRAYINERTAYYQKHKAAFHTDYEDGIAEFKTTLHTEQQKQKFKEYQAAFKVIAGRFDAKLMKAESMLCNTYEQRTILPVLSKGVKERFRKARSVVKYVELTIAGEALGNILGRSRTECNVEIAKAANLAAIVDNAKKKTLMFTSFVEVVDVIAARMETEGYSPAKVYGATNKDLTSIVKAFHAEPDLNPLVATFQSLSTAVPLTAANAVVFMNQPFRSGIRDQTIARAARLGQDEVVYVYDLLLDTGDAPNISTRSNDIMEWSRQQVAQILGVQNADLDSLSLEASDPEDGGYDIINEMLFDLDEESMETAVKLPQYLYHASGFAQDEIQPGFNHSKKLVKWDGTEDNTWLYAATDKDDVIMMGISSAMEKKFKLDRWSYKDPRKDLLIEVTDPHFKVEDLYSLPVYLYTIKPELDDNWVPNHNVQNNISGEYKTQNIINGNILRRETVDVKSFLRGVSIKVIKH